MNYNDYFEYREGALIWKLRPADSFATSRSFSLHKTRYAGAIAGHISINGYVQVRVNGKLDYAHRIIWQMLNGDIPNGCEIDHVDTNPQNNLISNLRLATSSNNKWNTNKPCTNTSGFKGVSLNKRTGRFTAAYKKNGKQNHLGYFDTAEEASEAYKKAIIKAFGEYHRL